MSKRKKEIIIAAAVLLVLIAALAVLVLTADKNEELSVETNSEVADTAISLYEHNTEDVISIAVKNQYGEYEIKGESSSEESSSAVVWSIEEFKGLPVMTTSMSSLATNAAKLTANGIIEENCTDLEKFGLENPIAEAKISFKTGTAQTVYVGNETPLGSEYYVRMNGDKSVYKVAEAFVESYFVNKESYLNCLILADIGDDETYPAMTEVSVARKDLAKPIVVKPLTDADKKITTNAEDSSVSSSFCDYKLVSPVNATIDFSKQGTILYGLYGLTADHAVCGYPTEEQKQQFGLTDPFCTVQMVLSDGKATKLVIGNSFEKDGADYRYAMLEGREVVYGFTEESLYWNTVEPMNFISRSTVMPYIFNLSGIEITKSDGTVYKFDIRDKKFFYGEKELNDEKFKSFCQYLYKAVATNVNYDNVEYSPDVTVKYSFNNAAIEPITIGYQRTDTRTIYVSQNGSVDFVAQAQYLDRLLENVDNVINGNDILMSW